MLSNEQFERAQRLALSLAGISLVERHRALLESRSRRVGIRDRESLETLLSGAEAGEDRAARQLLSLLTTKVTGFFRTPLHFECAAECAMHAVRRKGTARIWSAAAATGEEPWSLALTMLESFQRLDPPVSILATDVDSNALAIARRGEYSCSALESLSASRWESFLRPVGDGGWTFAPEAHRLIEFRVLNLVNTSWPMDAAFDVIFCRNVLMYLEASHRHSVLERMASLLAPEGVLMLDPAEHMGRAGDLFMRRSEGVYILRPAPRGMAWTRITTTESKP